MRAFLFDVYLPLIMDISFFAIQKIIFAVWLVLAVFIILRIVKKRRRLAAAGIEVEGEVIDLKFVYDNFTDSNVAQSAGLYHPVIQFLTLQNQQITHKYAQGRYPAAYRIGDKVTIVYDPAEPSSFTIKER